VGTPERATLSLSVKRLLEIESGFLTLKERKLRDLPLEMRVAAQFQSLQPALAAFREQENRLRDRQQDLEQLAPEARETEQREIHAQFRALRDTTRFDVPAPLKRLRPEDLPEPRKHDPKDDNTLGRAGIAAALAPEFFDLPDEAE
jgi:hypothetical protein